MHRGKWLPFPADQKRGKSSLQRCPPPSRLAIARRHSVPNAPYILPTLPTLPVEEGKLQIICFVPPPTILNIDLMARLKPAVFIDGWNEVKLILTPGKQIPRQCFVAWTVLGLEGQR